jgi:hypothetical protein
MTRNAVLWILQGVFDAVIVISVYFHEHDEENDDSDDETEETDEKRVTFLPETTE